MYWIYYTRKNYALTWQIVVSSLHAAPFDTILWMQTEKKCERKRDKKIYNPTTRCCWSFTARTACNPHKIELFIPRIELWIMFGVYLLIDCAASNGLLFTLATAECLIPYWFDYTFAEQRTMLNFGHIVITIKINIHTVLELQSLNGNLNCAIITPKWMAKQIQLHLSLSGKLGAIILP